jgi:hypothetical protein
MEEGVVVGVGMAVKGAVVIATGDGSRVGAGVATTIKVGGVEDKVGVEV